jgi:hypothetical protein
MTSIQRNPHSGQFAVRADVQLRYFALWGAAAGGWQRGGMQWAGAALTPSDPHILRSTPTSIGILMLSEYQPLEEHCPLPFSCTNCSTLLSFVDGVACC